MARHATPSPAVWLNSAGIAAVISVILAANAIPPGRKWRDLGFWPLARFFLIPFCVSNFSAVMHKAGLVLIFPRNLADNLVAAGTVACSCCSVQRPADGAGPLEVSSAVLQSALLRVSAG